MICPNCKAKLEIVEGELMESTNEGDELWQALGHCPNCLSDFKWTGKFRTVLVDEYDLKEITY